MTVKLGEVEVKWSDAVDLRELKKILSCPIGFVLIERAGIGKIATLEPLNLIWALAGLG